MDANWFHVISYEKNVIHLVCILAGTMLEQIQCADILINSYVLYMPTLDFLYFYFSML